MTKIERVLAELSELYEFYARIQQRTWRKAKTQPHNETHLPSVEADHQRARSPTSK